MAAAHATCLAVAAVYVGSLYVLGPGPRQAPHVVRRRMAAVLGTCCVAWLPLAYVRQALVDDKPPLLALLGLRSHGLLAAVASPLLLICLLFMGPLLHRALDADGSAIHPWAAASRTPLHAARDYCVAPLAEEWVFRASMVPLLWLQGVPRVQVVLLTPLHFGAAHVHHLRELVALQAVPWRRAVTMVAVQFAYTTLFGWFATYVFLATGHAAAAVTSHVLCNALGFPAFDAMSRHPCRLLLGVATASGIIAFGAALPRLLRPELFGNALYTGPCCCGSRLMCVP